MAGTSNCVHNITLRLLLFFEGTCRSGKLNECMSCNRVHGNVKLCGYWIVIAIKLQCTIPHSLTSQNIGGWNFQVKQNTSKSFKSGTLRVSH